MFKPKKRFGQNFLQDRGALQKISELLQIKDQLLLEIGPGNGNLTEFLLKKTNKMIAIEIDRDLIPLLKNRFKNLTIYTEDALQFDYTTLNAPLIITGNLPYNISTPLLFKFLAIADRIDRLGIMLQKEVADRIKAQPNTKAFGKLSILFQLKFDFKDSFDLPASAFYPPPKVNSTFLIAEPKLKPYPLNNQLLLSQLIGQAFNIRRKMLKNSLMEYRAFLSVEEQNKRPEELSVVEWVNLSNKICDLLTK